MLKYSEYMLALGLGSRNVKIISCYTQMSNAVNIIQQEWFKLSSTKASNRNRNSPIFVVVKLQGIF